MQHIPHSVSSIYANLFYVWSLIKHFAIARFGKSNVHCMSKSHSQHTESTLFQFIKLDILQCIWFWRDNDTINTFIFMLCTMHSHYLGACDTDESPSNKYRSKLKKIKLSSEYTELNIKVLKVDEMECICV